MMTEMVSPMKMIIVQIITTHCRKIPMEIVSEMRVIIVRHCQTVHTWEPVFPRLALETSVYMNAMKVPYA
jgi:hypothetical protein